MTTGEVTASGCGAGWVVVGAVATGGAKFATGAGPAGAATFGGADGSWLMTGTAATAGLIAAAALWSDCAMKKIRDSSRAFSPDAFFNRRFALQTRENDSGMLESRNPHLTSPVD